LGRSVGEGDALFDVALEALDGLGQELLLLLRDVAQGVDGLLGTIGLETSQSACQELWTGRTHAKLDGYGEEVGASLLCDLLATGDTGKVDVGWLDEALGTLRGLEQLFGESEWLSAHVSSVTRDFDVPVAGVGHGEGGRTSTVLGLDDLVATKLDAVDESVVLVVGNGDAGGDLAEEGQNGLAGVTADNRNSQLLRVRLTGDLSNECFGTNNVESGNTKQALGVEDTLGLQDLCRDGHGGVDRVGNDEDEGLRGDLSGDLNETLDDASIDVEEVITAHAGLACWDS
jgi:hypothetical protein